MPTGDGQPTRVLLVDDHGVVRSAIRRVIQAEPDLVVVAEAANGQRAIAEARHHQPDVIVLDMHMPGGDALQHLPAVRQAAPEARIVVLSMRSEVASVRAAFAGGACGYVLKEAADAELVSAIRTVAGGGQYVQASLGARLLGGDERSRERRAEGLSEREREVARLLALGHANAEIARLLWISPRTAETHRSHVMRKLGLTTRAELVQYALRTGLLDEQG